MRDVIAVNRKQGIVLTDDDEIYPVTHWFDPDGEDCAPENAAVCVAGRENIWFSVRLAEFEPAKSN